MPMMTGDQYRASLVDGRRCFIDGERIDDPAQHPLLAPRSTPSPRPTTGSTTPIRTRSIRCTSCPRPARTWTDGCKRSATATSPRAPPPRAWPLSRSRPRSASSDRSTATASTSSSSTCKAADVRCSEAITDAKGHRRRRPSQQDDPDFYVHVVDRERDGIVISGSKMHITRRTDRATSRSCSRPRA